LKLDEALKRWEKGDGLGNVYGSSKVVNDFNLKFKVYEKSQDIDKYLDPSLTKALK
jgi:NitT/TauT family transport system substrate-binding protein